MPDPTYQDHFITAGGRRWRALSGGRGPLVLCLHSYALTADMWRPVLPALLAAGYSVLALDLPGHGQSYRPRWPLGAPEIAAQVTTVLDELGAPRVSVLGNSLGGAVGCELAVRQPERVARLALVSPFGLDPDVAPFIRRRDFYAGLIFPTLWQAAFGRRPWVNRRRAAMTFADPARVPPGTFCPDYAGGWWHNHWGRGLVTLGLMLQHAWPAQNRAFVARRAAVRVPTLLVWGAQDHILPVAHAYSGQRLLPNARLHIFSDCGHLAHLEYPDEFNRLVVEFLGE